MKFPVVVEKAIRRAGLLTSRLFRHPFPQSISTAHIHMDTYTIQSSSSPFLPRRSSSQSTRTYTSASVSPSTTDLSHAPNAALPKHRTLFSQTRGSKPPVTGPPTNKLSNNTNMGPYGARRGHSSQRSFTGSAADLTSNFLGNVKRSLSLAGPSNRREKDNTPSVNVSYILHGSFCYLD